MQLFTPQSGGNKFGNEFRGNLAGVYNLYSNPDSLFRQWDTSLELNYLKLSRDESAGISEFGTGGDILYVTPGTRIQLNNFNLGAGIRIPIARSLNEVNLQQGAEGLENYRLIFTGSFAF